MSATRADFEGDLLNALRDIAGDAVTWPDEQPGAYRGRFHRASPATPAVDGPGRSSCHPGPGAKVRVRLSADLCCSRVQIVAAWPGSWWGGVRCPPGAP